MNSLLAPLAAGFRLGVRLRHAAYRRGLFRTHRLAVPVISIGNLTVGGTGKTPLVALVAKIFLRHGWKPSILTRGYARRSKSDLIVAAPGPGRLAEAREVGDEPALLARLLPEVPLIICSDRFRGGRVAEDRFQVDAHILDDGFQHLALARDVDVVALDASMPLSDLAPLPVGRAREPLAALARAHLVVFTRIDFASSGLLENLAREVNPRLELFHTSTQLVGIADTSTGRGVPVEALQEQKLLAFCGIANPRAFFQDARRWGINVVAEEAFLDHHVYTEQELQRLVIRARKRGVTALLTTEKDAVKLPSAHKPELPILACSMAFRVIEGEEFDRTLLRHWERAKRSNR